MAQHGSRPATNSLTPFEVPATIASALSLNGSYDYFRDDARKILAHAKHQGIISVIPQLAADATAALAPIPRRTLVDRLTLLGMSMANGKDSEQVKAWLHETTRLLEDLPASVLLPAIDDLVKEPGRVFVPSVGEIREKADVHYKKLHRQAARLNILRQMLEDGVPLPEWVEPVVPSFNPAPPEPNCTPEEAAAILAEFGLPSSGGLAAKLAAGLKEDRPTSAQEAALAGVEPRPERPRDPYALLP